MVRTAPRRDFLIIVKPQPALSTTGFLSTTELLLIHQHKMATNPSSNSKPPRLTLTPSQSKDSSYTYIHFNRPRDADLFEDFWKFADKLPDDEIYVPPHNQPINPEDEDDVVVGTHASSQCLPCKYYGRPWLISEKPDQHAAFGIQRATQKTKETAWKDLGLKELMRKGPEKKGETAFKAGSRSLPR
jgi:hypothetical protein